MSYRPSDIEPAWQQRWAEAQVHQVGSLPEAEEFYCLEMLPYPSGRIHMGHVRNYSIGDVVTRHRRMKGMAVMHPIGWDSLGLPAENAAIDKGIHPAEWTRDNIDAMRAQLKRLGFSYDWSREIASYRPEYYRWNQWLFLRFLERGLAYRREGPVNWCPSCDTVLANEQVEDGHCWRCDSVVEERRLNQWFFRITAYAEELLDRLDALQDWPERVRLMQRNWIGRSEGAEVEFTVPDADASLRVFTTRLDTIFGATFVVLAPEHPFVRRLLEEGPGPASDLEPEQFRRQVERIAGMHRRQRRGEELEKDGVFTGWSARNPYSGEEVPVWIANFVLMDYGTGAIMAVPAHDERDLEFARRFDLEVRPVVRPENERPDWVDDAAALASAFTDDGVLMDGCGDYAGLSAAEARKAMAERARAEGFGGPAVDYKLKDWGISRQRYWGTPIPIVYCDECGTVPVPDEDLPVELPEDVDLRGAHGSPLAEVEEFVATSCPGCGGAARRETDTMDTFVDSSWYYLRYLSPDHDEAPFEPEVARRWLPVDFYIGGIEHAVLHLLYFRFFCKAMRDMGLLEVDEPVVELLTQGMVLKDGVKMSKSRGNVVDPDEMVERYGADTTRLFVLFAAPPERDLAWDERGVEGCARFLNRVWNLVTEALEECPELPAARTVEPGGDGAGPPRALARLRRKAHDTTRRVTEDIEERLHFNTAIAALMELVNEAFAAVAEVPPREAGEHLWIYRDAFERLVVLLSPFAPHIAQELWQRMGHDGFLLHEPWPGWEPSVLQRDQVELAVQVDGRVRGRIKVPADLDDEDRILELAREDPNVGQHLEGRELVKAIVVPKRIVNLVTRDVGSEP